METKPGRITVKKSDEESSSLLPAKPFIERLYIFNAHELHLGYAAKFPNVEFAYVYALTSFAGSGESGWIRLCLETARSVVAFLECFPKLKFTHIGGYAPNHPDFQKIALDGTHNDLAYMQKMCVTDGHQDAFRAMSLLPTPFCRYPRVPKQSPPLQHRVRGDPSHFQRCVPTLAHHGIPH